jgi:two-component system OmpR family response regulator
MRKHRILYVEDDPDIAQIGMLALHLDDRIEARLATGGAEALMMLSMPDWRPEALLLDVMMPGMDGIGVMEAMATDPALAAVRVILMTARVRDTDLSQYRRMGAVGVIAKPFDPIRLAIDVLAHIPDAD